MKDDNSLTYKLNGVLKDEAELLTRKFNNVEMGGISESRELTLNNKTTLADTCEERSSESQAQAFFDDLTGDPLGQKEDNNFNKVLQKDENPQNTNLCRLLTVE